VLHKSPESGFHQKIVVWVVYVCGHKELECTGLKLGVMMIEGRDAGRVASDDFVEAGGIDKDLDDIRFALDLQVCRGPSREHTDGPGGDGLGAPDCASLPHDMSAPQAEDHAHGVAGVQSDLRIGRLSTRNRRTRAASWADCADRGWTPERGDGVGYDLHRANSFSARRQ
jgi:hypothetical protein